MNQDIDQPLVLVADDDPEFRKVSIPKKLERHLNARILTAKDVLEACLVAAEHDADGEDPLRLIVLDMHMPLHEGKTTPADDGGIQFLRSHQLTECPVVVFTAYPSYRNCVRAVQAGAAAYLPKKMIKDAHGGPEGGIDQLVDICRQLLTKPVAQETRIPPDGDWIQENYEWLCREFGGQWVAFVAASKAPSAGITGTERGGLVIASAESRQDLARLIAVKLPFLEEIPHIVSIPRSEYGEDETGQET